MVDQLTEVDIHYPDSPLTASPRGASRQPAGGDRAPDIPLAADSPCRRLYGVLATGRFAVLTVGGAAIELPAALAALATPVHVDAAQGYDAGHVYLIRPDAYVALSTAPDDTAAIFAALERVRAG
jgi:hypothetical protein